MGEFTENRVLAGVPVFLTGDHHRRGCARRPQVAPLFVQMNTYRHTLGQAHPFQVGINRRHPFRIIGAAGVGDASRNAIYGTFKDAVAAKRRDLCAVARTNAFQFGLFHIGKHIE